MERQFHIMRENRKVFIRMIESLTIDQLNEIPEGFNNNIAWNFNHMVVIPQFLNYVKAGVPLTIPKERLEKYARGTKPEGFISGDEIDYYKDLALKIVDQLEADWNAGKLNNYEAFKTSLGVDIQNSADALHYVVTHDFFHVGYASAQKKLVLAKATTI